MKKLLILILIILLSFSMLSQEKMVMQDVEFNSKCKDLVVQLHVLFTFGQPFAKSHHMTPTEYGKYVADEYIKQGWAKGGNFEGLTHACLYYLSCQQNKEDIEIMTNNPDLMIIKSILPNGFHKKAEPCILITGKEYQEFFASALGTIAKSGGCNYSTETDGVTVYTIISKE